MTLPDDFNCRMRPMRAADLDAVLEWRNDVLVRRFMFTNHAIGMGEHLAWFERVGKAGHGDCPAPVFSILDHFHLSHYFNN